MRTKQDLFRNKLDEGVDMSTRIVVDISLTLALHMGVGVYLNEVVSIISRSRDLSHVPAAV